MLTHEMKDLDNYPLRPYLTFRQRQCMRLLVEGKTAGEISLELGISVRTIHEHLRRARIQLGCYSTLQAAVKAERLGLLNEPKIG